MSSEIWPPATICCIVRDSTGGTTERKSDSQKGKLFMFHFIYVFDVILHTLQE